MRRASRAAKAVAKSCNATLRSQTPPEAEASRSVYSPRITFGAMVPAAVNRSAASIWAFQPKFGPISA